FGCEERPAQLPLTACSLKQSGESLTNSKERWRPQASTSAVISGGDASHWSLDTCVASKARSATAPEEFKALYSMAATPEGSPSHRSAEKLCRNERLLF